MPDVFHRSQVLQADLEAQKLFECEKSMAVAEE